MELDLKEFTMTLVLGTYAVVGIEILWLAVAQRSATTWFPHVMRLSDLAQKGILIITIFGIGVVVDSITSKFSEDDFRLPFVGWVRMLPSKQEARAETLFDRYLVKSALAYLRHGDEDCVVIGPKRRYVDDRLSLHNIGHPAQFVTAYEHISVSGLACDLAAQQENVGIRCCNDATHHVFALEGPGCTAELLTELTAIVPSDGAFEEAFARARVPKGPLARYYLMALENEQRGEAEPEFVPNANEEQVNLEHVLPQRSSPSEWGASFTAEERKEFVHRLGNLALLQKGPNGRIGNKPFGIKQPILSKSSFALTAGIGAEPDWTKATIEKRQAALASLAVKVWPR